MKAIVRCTHARTDSVTFGLNPLKLKEIRNRDLSIDDHNLFYLSRDSHGYMTIWICHSPDFDVQKFSQISFEHFALILKKYRF